jgi:hypothetical protein
VLQTTCQCGLLSAPKLSSLEVFLEIRKEVVVSRGKIKWVGRMCQNLKVKICQFLVRNGRLVGAALSWRRRIPFRKLTELPLDVWRSAAAFVEKCNVVFCRDGCTLFQVGYKQNFVSAPEERYRQFAWRILCLELRWTRRTIVSPFLGSRWNQPKMACEASIQSFFWSALRHLDESFLMSKVSRIIQPTLSRLARAGRLRGRGSSPR